MVGDDVFVTTSEKPRIVVKINYMAQCNGLPLLHELCNSNELGIEQMQHVAKN